MPNPIKYSTSAQTLALKKGNYWIGTGDVGKGPTSTTSYYNGITPPSGGYTIYLNKASGGPSIYTAANDAALISLSNTIAGQTFATAAAALAWFATQADKMVFNADYPAIITDGLVLNLDAGFTPSYPTTGTTWYDVSSSGNNGTLTNGPAFNTGSGGSIEFDGTDDYVLTSLNAASFSSLNMSLGLWFNTNTIKNNTFALLAGARAGNDSYQPLGFFIETRNSWAGNYSSNPGIVAISNYSRYAKSAPNSIANNTWYYVVQTATETETKLYINGSLVNTTTENTTLYTSIPYYFGIGSYGNFGTYPGSTQYSGNYSNQKITAAQIYNRSLSDAEVLQNYNATKSRFGL
jgi:hypothetical protein